MQQVSLRGSSKSGRGMGSTRATTSSRSGRESTYSRIFSKRRSSAVSSRTLSPEPTASDPFRQATPTSISTLTTSNRRAAEFRKILGRTGTEGKYDTNQPATFGENDWNGDGLFCSIDIVSALQSESYLGGGTGLTTYETCEPRPHSRFALRYNRSENSNKVDDGYRKRRLRWEPSNSLRPTCA